MKSTTRVVAVVVAGALAAGCVGLLVGGPRGGGGGTQDTRVAHMVEQRIGADELLRGANIEVSASRGIVTLRGTVYSERARERAIALAADVPDVARVVALELRVVD